MAIVRLNDRLQLTLLFGQLVKVGVRIGVQGVHLIQASQRLLNVAHGLFHRLADGLLQIELRLLRQVADLNPRLRARLAFDIGVNAGHNAQQGGFPRAV